MFAFYSEDDIVPAMSSCVLWHIKQVERAGLYFLGLLFPCIRSCSHYFYSVNVVFMPTMLKFYAGAIGDKKEQ